MKLACMSDTDSLHRRIPEVEIHQRLAAIAPEFKARTFVQMKLQKDVLRLGLCSFYDFWIFARQKFVQGISHIIYLAGALPAAPTIHGRLVYID